MVEMHTATKVLLKLMVSLVYLLAIMLIVALEPSFLLRFLYVLIAGLSVMFAEMLLWPPDVDDRATLARSVWKRFLWKVFQSAVIAGALVGLLVAFVTKESRFLVLENDFIMINQNYLIVYAITWLIMLIITNVVVGG